MKNAVILNTELFNIIIISVLMTLSIFYFMIFLGRRNKKEIYNLYISLLSFSISSYIFTSTSLQDIIFKQNLTFYPFLGI